MKKSIKNILIASLSLLCAGVAFAACQTGGTTSSSLENSPFLETYQAEYGNIYYFENTVLNGKPLEYAVTLNGDSIEVKNYGFMVSTLDAYKVEVRYLGETNLLDTFEIKAKDNGAPNLAFSYQDKASCQQKEYGSLSPPFLT